MNTPNRTRRDILKTAGLLAGGALVFGSPFVKRTALAAISRSQKKVVIVGAGLAGLSCAYELSKNGYHVDLLEAKNRPGGRVETLRNEYFSDPLFAETGAYWINETHTVTMRYIEHLGLKNKLALLAPPGKYLLYYIRNKSVPAHWGPNDPWPDELGLTPQEKKMGLGGIMASMFCSDPDVGNPNQLGWPSEAVIKKYGDMSFLKFLQAPRSVLNPRTNEKFTYQPSHGAIELVRPFLSWWDDFDKVSALEMIRDGVAAQCLCEDPAKPSKWYTIKTGMDSLPKAFASKLHEAGVKIHYNTPVMGIKQDEHSVTVSYINPVGERHDLSSDYLVCAIPFSTLRMIKGLPTFSAAKRKAIAEIAYASVCRFYVQCEKPILAMENGAGFTDLPIGNLLDMTFVQDGEQGKILQTFMVGRQAQDVAAMREADRTAFMLKHLERVFPGITTNGIEHTAFKNWDEDRWALGAYPYFTPEQFVSLKDIASPEGRIHFAGEHTSTYSSWMEGALQSGQRCAKEITQAA